MTTAALVRSVSLVALLAAGSAGANPLPEQQSLSSDDVSQVLRQVVAEAQARDAAATIAVVDRVGNVLAVYQSEGAKPNFTAFVDPGKDVEEGSGFAELRLPVLGLVISKAVTGAYLSSNGNAFSTRTASQIVQENFNPGSDGLEGGPLFGVQFSSLPCSDLAVRFDSDSGTLDPRIGPKRTPAGLAADPGGFPLYKDDTLVGGLGVIADGNYGLDRDINDEDDDLDEQLAAAGTQGFEPDEDLTAERVTVDGRTLRYSDVGDLESDEENAAEIDLDDTGAFVPVTGYYAGGGALAGQAFGFGASGIRPDPTGRFGSDRAFILTTAGGTNRFPPRAGVGGLTATEVNRLLAEGIEVALQARAQIRRPLDSHVEVTISVVDTTGAILGIVRTPDAPVFGTDVSLQKARSVLTFSSARGLDDLRRFPANAQGLSGLDFIGPADEFLDGAVDGGTAFSARAIGNIARPFYPDGQNGNSNGPLSVDDDRFSVFNTGLQVALILDNVSQHVGFVLGQNADTPPRCANIARLANGLQIFAGGVPIYRNGDLIGGIGISGDGIDQDDMVAALAVDRTAQALSGGLENAPDSIRADRLDPDNINLRYVSCPFAPFLDSDRQNVCEGL